MKPIIMLLDVDGVLADFAGASLAFLRTIGLNYTHDQITTSNIHEALELSDATSDKLKEIWHAPGFCYEIPTLPGARAGVELLRGIGQVYAVTSPMHSLTWGGERRSWLRNYMGFLDREIVSTEAKHLIVGHILVDDKPGHLETWHHGQAICWAQPYNTEYIGLRTSSWGTVAGIARGLRAQGT